MPLERTPEEMEELNLLTRSFNMEYVKIGGYTQWYNPQLTTREKAIKELREAVEADTCLPFNSG